MEDAFEAFSFVVWAGCPAGTRCSSLPHVTKDKLMSFVRCVSEWTRQQRRTCLAGSAFDTSLSKILGDYSDLVKVFPSSSDEHTRAYFAIAEATIRVHWTSWNSLSREGVWRWIGCWWPTSKFLVKWTDARSSLLVNTSSSDSWHYFVLVLLL